MKRVLSCIIIAALLLCTSLAYAAPAPSDALFTYISDAMNLLAAGAYDRVVATLPFSDAAPSADEWKNFAEGSFSTLTGAMPQSEYIVLYWYGNVWKVAMPIYEPASDTVETLVLSSEDGVSFNGYGCALWGSVRNEYESSSHVKWSKEYHNVSYALIEFDE